MSRCVFLFKENDADNTDGRDCVKYIDLEDLKENHVCYDGKFNVEGACYSKSLREEDAAYENITTILTKADYKRLCNPDGSDLTDIIAKLGGKRNRKLFKRIKKEEIEYLMNAFDLDETDIEQIFNGYYLEYRDRGIVSCVFDDAYDCGYEEALSLGLVKGDNDITSKYFNFEKFGEDLVNDSESYMELNDGRIVYLNY